MGLRKIRNQVIRANFGVEGLRHFRRLNKQGAALTKQRAYLTRQLAVLKHARPPGADMLLRLRRWWTVRKLLRAVDLLDRKLLRVRVQQVALVAPERVAFREAA